MQIDWLTVAAQWINFLILMWLLKRFLYRPIIDAMAKRRENLAQQSQQAERSAAQAEQLAAEYRAKLAELEQQRSELIAAARQQAAAERETLLQQARAETQNQAERWQQAFEREKAELQTQLSHDFNHLLTAIAHKAVRDLSGLEWEHALCGQFLQHLQQLPETDKQRLAQSARDGLTLTGSFEIDAIWRQRLTEALQQILSIEAPIRFQTHPENALGLSLNSASYSLEWSTQRYFDEMQQQIAAMLKQSA